MTPAGLRTAASRPVNAAGSGWVEALKAGAGPVLLAFALTRGMLALLIQLSSAMIPSRPGDYLHASAGNLLLDGLIRHDSWWYREIVRSGYTAGNLQTGEQGTVAFFPLYPMLVKAASVVTGNVFVAGVVVSNLCFLLALFAIWSWARTDYGDASAARTVFYVAAAPTAVFFSAMYTESLYVLLVASTFLLARRGRFWLAAIPGALAAGTRNTGVLMALVIALEALQQAGVSLRMPLRPPGEAIRFLGRQARTALSAWASWLPAFIVPLGLLAYMVWLSRRFGDPLAFIHVQATWGRDTGAGGAARLIPHTVSQLGLQSFPDGRFNPVVFMDIAFTLLLIPLVAAVTAKTRWSYAAYCLLTFLVPLATGSVGSMTRYMLMLLPCFLLLGWWGRRWWCDRLVLGVSLPLFAYFAILFSHWYFAG